MGYTPDYKRTYRGRALTLLSNARKRSKEKNIHLDLDVEWIIKKLQIGTCEITNIPFNLEPTTEHHTRRWDAPSLDRKDKSKPYNEENTRVVLWAVNCALAEYGTDTMLPILKAMVRGIESAQEKSTTSVPTGSYIPGAVGAELGSVSTPWTWENSDDAHHHCGADARKDADCGTKESSGDSVGHGDTEVGAFDVFDHIESSGVLETAPRRLREAFERLRSESREPSLAAGTASQIRQFGD